MPLSSQSVTVPTFDEMMLPTIQALEELGGSGNIKEINAKVSLLLKLSEETLAVPHGNTSQSEVEYRLYWSRTYLKKYGVLESTGRGVWSILSTFGDSTRLDPKEVVRSVRASDKATKERNLVPLSPISDISSVVTPGEPGLITVEISEEPEAAFVWNVELHNILLGLTPAAFERLIQRLLRESGFIQVEVTGKSGDGGIDGIGIARINGFLSFQVLFQAKRYQGSVSPSQIRDFRGAMQGRTDKGLFITTGTFTREAAKEATRDGAPPIDLIDGEQLILRLKELQLGVKIHMVEAVEIDTTWFQNL